jgi:hypothetical protein
MADPPIACSLSGGALGERLAEIAAIGRDGLVESRVGRAEARLVFHDRVRARLEAVVAAESECCPFLSMTIRDGREGTTLRIEAPAGGEVAMRDLAAAFTLGG